MRTTLTLDDALAERLKREAARSGRSSTQTVNDSIRLGLNATQAAVSCPPFKVRPKDFKPRPGIDFENISALLEEVEGPGHR